MSDTDTPQAGAAPARAELRSVAFTDLEAADDGSRFSGYAAVFDSEADLGSFTESISRGAFRKVLAESRNVPMLWNHNPDYSLATTKAGTLKLSEDSKGLRVEADLGSDFISDFVRERVRRGEVEGMSYGFVAGPGNQKIEQRGAKLHRVLLGFTRLLDVSPTWDPAYADTSAELRAAVSAAGWPQEILEGEGPQLEEAVADPQDPDAEEARDSGSDEVATPNLAAVRWRLSLINIEEGGHKHYEARRHTRP